MLPFTHDQFIAVFAEYNLAIWPAQLVAYGLGLAIAGLAASTRARRGGSVSVGLALMWAWTGVAYHGIFFSRVNPAATLFGLLFVVQAALVAHAGLTRRLVFDRTLSRAWRAVSGWALVAYSAVLYPLIGAANGMAYPGTPTFGVTPCPLTLFTWGMLLMAHRVPWWLLVIPFAWSVVGGSAALVLRVPQDWLLLASAVTPALLLWRGGSQRLRT